MSSNAADRRIILLMPSLTYRATSFVAAAERLGLEVIRGLDMPKPLARFWKPTLPLDFRDLDQATRDLVVYARQYPVGAIIAVDDAATVLAALACAALGLPHNDPDAANAARDKHVMRSRLREAGVPSPRFALYHTDDDPEAIAPAVRYPCVVKPLLLSGSQGVIRADDPESFARAFRRVRAIVLGTGGEPGEGRKGHLLVEDYVQGVEVALEGIMASGRLQVLALFDKPDPLEGPFFEETLYVTPSRLPAGAQQAIVACATAACAALGLREGPIHAELRLNEQGPWIVEVAGRSIGGLCSRILRFGTEGTSLEELIVRRAMGMEMGTTRREARAGGVMMLPIPRAGILRGVDGLEEAQAVPGIEEIEITIPLKHPVVPLPEGSSYLGFIFARGERPGGVEEALREAHRRLRFHIAPRVVLHERAGGS
jgi:formate-dependent phosphoribosylglycinamide formyltransferase (GAR transformylase)